MLQDRFYEFCKDIFFILTLAMLSQNAIAQKDVPYFGKINWINGFEKEISGENISYFSAFPDYATTALLTRCTDGRKIIEWETSAVPKIIKGKYGRNGVSIEKINSCL